MSIHYSFASETTTVAATTEPLFGWPSLSFASFDVDNREPLLVFDVPICSFTTTTTSSFGLYVPSLVFWLQILIIVAMQCILSAMLSIWTYTYVIQPQQQSRQQAGSSSKRNTSNSNNDNNNVNVINDNSINIHKYLVGYGLLIPMWLCLPRLQLHLLGIRNLVINFCLVAIVPTLSIFRTMEAMYGCVPFPEMTCISPLHYALYCGSPMVLQWNSQTKTYIPTTWNSIITKLRNFCIFCFLVGILQSFLSVSHYQPFYDATGMKWYNIERLFSWGQVANNILHALLFQLYMMAFSEGMMAVTALLFGKEPETIMENPMLESTSPSEFWSERWNKLVHGVLKRGVYIPVRKANLPKSVAVVATFVASSLFHEWILTNLFYNDDDVISNYVGGSTIFFLWNGMLLVLESQLCNMAVFRWMKLNLPRPIRTFLVVMLAVPLAHCFCDPYVYSDFFRHGQVAFPMLLPIEHT